MSETRKYIEVIHTERDKDLAYIAIIYGYPEKDAINADVKLSWIENLMRCKFEDGFHPFIRMEIQNIKIQFLNKGK